MRFATGKPIDWSVDRANNDRGYVRGNILMMGIEDFICRSKAQRKALGRLLTEVLRRSKHLKTYSEIWATRRVQKRLMSFLHTLGGAGIGRLIELQDLTVGSENTRIV